MVTLHLDLRAGATAGALLGALLESGASLEAVERAVATLGAGDVRLSVHAGTAGSSVRVRAPEGAPDAETWGRLRPHVALLATGERTVEVALEVLDTLFAARGRVHGVPAEDVDVDPFSGLDDLAAAVALGAATAALGLTQVETSAVGHGTGELATLEGLVQLPGPVVAALLDDVPTLEHDVALELVDPVGAAFVAALRTGAWDPTGVGTAADGRGRVTGNGEGPRSVLAYRPVTTG